MELPNAKQLKKLADACRKAGIKSFKGQGIEFTLTDEAPVSNYKRTKSNKTAVQENNEQTIISENLLTPEELLFWSVNGSEGNEI